LPGNLPRVLPDATVAALRAAWPVPPVFRWLARAGGVPLDEMLQVFNCGIGMVLVVAPGDVDAATALLTRDGEAVYLIGAIEPGAGEARIDFTPPTDWLT
jgi:phosphoribosylformylglycinamidine cyclo-ligase